MINSFIYQGGGVVDYATLSASPYDLLIVETGETSFGATPALTSAELMALQDDGRTVIGYVNALVLDVGRQFAVDEGVMGPALGPFTGTIPDWLPVDEMGQPLASNVFGAYADIFSPEWIDIVADQAEAIVDAGYDGVYLDNVGDFFDLAVQRVDTLSFEQTAEGMMALVNEVVERIGTDAFLAINGGAYIVSDAGPEKRSGVGFRRKCRCHFDGVADFHGGLGCCAK